jgi:hypothetical protein
MTNGTPALGFALGLAFVLLVPAGCGADAAHGSEERGIVFSSSRDGDFEIYVMNSEGDGIHQLTHNASEGLNEADDYAPAWSPDGRRVAFASTRDHEGDGFESQELYVMAADGSGQIRLTENQTGEGAPSWSSDGDSLLYARRLAPGEDAFELALMRSDGARVRPLMEIDGYGSGALSPDGSRLAFTRCGSEGDELDCEIWVAEADGDDAHVLVDWVGTAGRCGLPTEPESPSRATAIATGIASSTTAGATTVRSTSWTPTAPISSASPTIRETTARRHGRPTEGRWPLPVSAMSTARWMHRARTTRSTS